LSNVDLSNLESKLTTGSNSKVVLPTHGCGLVKDNQTVCPPCLLTLFDIDEPHQAQ